MIIDQLPLTNKFISVPKEMSALNCAAFIAGVVKGVLDATNFVRIRNKTKNDLNLIVEIES